MNFQPGTRYCIAATLCQLAGQLGMIVLLDNANIVPGDSQNLFNLAINTPGTKFVFAHLGATNFRFWNTIVFARTAKDVYKENLFRYLRDRHPHRARVQDDDREAIEGRQPQPKLILMSSNGSSQRGDVLSFE